MTAYNRVLDGIESTKGVDPRSMKFNPSKEKDIRKHMKEGKCVCRSIALITKTYLYQL